MNTPTSRLSRFGVCVALVLMCGAIALAAQTPPQGGAGARRGAPPPAQPQGGGMAMGPLDRPPVEVASADRGRALWASECINCHGTQARGTEKGPNLVRSLVILHDRYGSELGPFLKKGHPTQSGKPSPSVTDAEIRDLANFLRQRVNDTLRGSPIFTVQNILTGDAKAGAEYFTGAGKCTQCHSVTGNLAGVASKYDPVTLQQRFLFPSSGVRGRGASAVNAVTVTVTPAAGSALSGVLIQMDDFTVTLRDSSGVARTIKRVPGVTVVKTDPFAAHIALLDTITDKNIHDVVAYLETLK